MRDCKKRSRDDVTMRERGSVQRKDMKRDKIMIRIPISFYIQYSYTLPPTTPTLLTPHLPSICLDGISKVDKVSMMTCSKPLRYKLISFLKCVRSRIGYTTYRRIEVVEIK